MIHRRHAAAMTTCSCGAAARAFRVRARASDPHGHRGGRASATVEMNEIRAAAATARENHRRSIRNGRQRRRGHSGVWEVVYFQGRYRKIRPLKN